MASELARITPGKPAKHVRVVPPKQPHERRPVYARTRPVDKPEEPEAEKKPEKKSEKRKKQTVVVKPARSEPKFISNGSNTVKLEFLIGLALIVLAPVANSDIKPDVNYTKRVISWILVFMLLFPLSGSSRPEIVRLANATGLVILLVISIKGTKSGFGVNVPALINAIVAKVQPIATPPPGVTEPIPGTNSTITGPQNGNDWIIGTSSDF